MSTTITSSNNNTIVDYAMWKHQTSGGVFAVALNGEGTVIAVCGPLHYSEYTTTHPSDCNLGDEDAEWIMDNIADFEQVEFEGTHRAE